MMVTRLFVSQLVTHPTVVGHPDTLRAMRSSYLNRGCNETFKAYPILERTGPMRFLVLDGSIRVIALHQLNWASPVKVEIIAPDTLNQMIQYVYNLNLPSPFNPVIFQTRFQNKQPHEIVLELQVEVSVLSYLNLIH